MALIFTQLASYSFTRLDVNPIDPAFWATLQPSIPDGGPMEQLAVVSNQCVCPTSAANANTGGAEFLGVSVPSNCYVEFKINTCTISGFAGVGLRSDITSFIGYELSFVGPLGAAVTLNIDNIGPAGGTIGSVVTVVNSGDIVRLAAFGNSLTAYVNGTLVLTATPDSQYTSGTTFFEMIDAVGVNDTKVSSFAVGSVASSTPTSGSNYPGSFEGLNLKQAFYNPNQLDLMQVVNEGGKVVWNLTASGVSNTNPAAATSQAIIGKFFGQSFAQAFPNLNKLDVLQILSPGNAVVFHVDYQGIANTP